MECCPAQVFDPGPAQDVAPLTFNHDGIYISRELWGYCLGAFPHGTVGDMFDLVKLDIDDERAEFTGSLAWRGPPPPLKLSYDVVSIHLLLCFWMTPLDFGSIGLFVNGVVSVLQNKILIMRCDALVNDINFRILIGGLYFMIFVLHISSIV